MTQCQVRNSPDRASYAQKIQQDFADRFFSRRPDNPDQVFEIGLCLAGAVSAGAYTAGVLDFLFEALDCWYRAKADAALAPLTPPHDAVISVIAGASAGGVSGAIAAIAAQYRFPPAPVQPTETALAAERNPFYDAWVSSVDFKSLFDTSDIAGKEEPLLSLLDCSALDTTVRRALDYSAPETAPWRRYLTNPLRIILSVGNLRGVPYRMALRGNDELAHSMRMHTDYMRFALELPQGYPLPRPQDACRNDEVILRHAEARQAAWQLLGTSALASGAFPLALKPRQLARCAADYDYRRCVVPGDRDGGELERLQPDFPDGMGDRYDFVCVDGGTFDNEPLEQTRIELAGPLGRNPRGALDVRRATILVDPFAEPPGAGPSTLPERVDDKHTDLGFFKSIAGAILGAYTENARTKPVDLALAMREDVYSRYLVTPARSGDGLPEKRGNRAIAAGALGGFLGFLSLHYRHHDFHLGRRNCQHFLRRHFTLPKHHRLFDGWNTALKDEWLDKTVTVFDQTGQRIPIHNYYRHEDGRLLADDAQHLPIIPLLGSAAEPIALPDSPRGKGSVEPLKQLIEQRIDKVVDRLAAFAVPWYGRPVLWALKSYARSKLNDLAVSALESGVKDIDARF